MFLEKKMKIIFSIEEKGKESRKNGYGIVRECLNN